MESPLGVVPPVVFVIVAVAALLAAFGVVVRSMTPEEFAKRIFMSRDLDGVRPYFSAGRYQAALTLLLAVVLVVTGASLLSLAVTLLGRWLLPGIALR
jgi:hypothetical protein